jgi:hypothetical protein
MSYLRPDIVAHTCNSSYLGVRDQGDHGSRLALAKSPQDPILLKSLDVVAHSCHHSYLGSINRKIIVQAGPGKNKRPYLKNN